MFALAPGNEVRPAIKVRFISDHVLVDDVMVEAGSNVSIGCPGMTRNTFVVQLEWRCRGECGGMPASKKSLNPEDNVQEVILLKYVKDQDTTVLSSPDRIRLEMDMFALAFDPVTDKDEGRYLCLINNRPLPDAVIKMNVLGKQLFSFLYLGTQTMLGPML